MKKIGPSFLLFHDESLLSKVYRRDKRDSLTHRHQSKNDIVRTLLRPILKKQPFPLKISIASKALNYPFLLYF